MRLGGIQLQLSCGLPYDVLIISHAHMCITPTAINVNSLLNRQMLCNESNKPQQMPPTMT